MGKFERVILDMQVSKVSFREVLKRCEGGSDQYKRDEEDGIEVEGG